jgi:predicted phage-related endonuclease
MDNITKQVNDYKSLKTTIKDFEHKLKSIEDEIKNHMGDEEELIVGGNTIRWKKVTTNRFDTTAFSEQHPVLYEQFLKQSESRRFTVT